MSAVLLVGAFAGCSSSSSTTDNKTEDNAATDEAADGERTLVVGVPGTPKPYNYVNDSGELVGYEIDMLNAMAEKMNVKLDYQVTEFESMFAGLDAGRYDLIIGNISKKPEREEKYLFCTEPYF